MRPAQIVDKKTYSPWLPRTGLLGTLIEGKIDTIVVSGGETDVSVLGAVDAGFRVIIATDALCSSNDETHAAIIEFYRERLPAQIEAAETDEILDTWQSR